VGTLLTSSLASLRRCRTFGQKTVGLPWGRGGLTARFACRWDGNGRRRSYHPLESSTNENTNGLLWQYLPSGTALKGKTKQLPGAVKELNARMRKSLAFATPEEFFRQEMERIKK